jgi:hypothetical protein
MLQDKGGGKRIYFSRASERSVGLSRVEEFLMIEWFGGAVWNTGDMTLKHSWDLRRSRQLASYSFYSLHAKALASVTILNF